MERARSATRRPWGRWIIASAAIAAFALIAPTASVAKKPERVRVMSRNLYLGADLSPGTSATNFQDLVDAAGQILNQVDVNDFPTRAKGLAQEIINRNPDLVGLQEAALWRDAPCSDNPVPPSATHVHPGGNFLRLLMNQLNSGHKRYRLVIAKPEFDFQTWANTDGDEMTGSPLGCDIEGRLTMRDAILTRVGRVKTTDAKSGTFDTLLQVTPGGYPLNVTRGWTSVNAKVNGTSKLSDTRWFRFVNTHLEAFDSQSSNHTNKGTDVGNGEVRQAQANDLISKGGPATSRLPVILVGDLNSDTRTPIIPGDELADQDLLGAGFKERSTYNPLGCCLDTAVLTVGSGGNASQFDHKVDHVMTNDPRHIKLVDSLTTGRRPHNGFWDSDHAGLFSNLRFK